MTLDQRLVAVSDRRIALLIDADNVSHAKISAILAELSKYGTANVRRAYGDWASAALKGWKDKLHDFAIRPIQQFSYSAGKNATEIALVIDAMELLYTQKPEAFCLVSSDADFTPLVMPLKASGHEVYGFGERKTPTPFVNDCTTFLYMDTLEGAGDQPTPSSEASPGTSVGEAAAASTDHGGDCAAVVRRPLSQDTKLVSILRGSVDASAHEDGWASMSAAGSAAKRQASIDPRNYGVKNFPALFAATGLFDIVKMDNGQGFVADRRNQERTPRPVR